MDLLTAWMAETGWGIPVVGAVIAVFVLVPFGLTLGWFINHLVFGPMLRVRRRRYPCRAVIDHREEKARAAGNPRNYSVVWPDGTVSVFCTEDAAHAAATTRSGGAVMSEAVPAGPDELLSQPTDDVANMPNRPRFASGGAVVGPCSSDGDSVPVLLFPGYTVPKDQVWPEMAALQEAFNAEGRTVKGETSE